MHIRAANWIDKAEGRAWFLYETGSPLADDGDFTMSTTAFETLERLEKLAAWHRATAEHAGSLWVWEARLLAAEDLERQAARIRSELAVDQLAEECLAH